MGTSIVVIAIVLVAQGPVPKAPAGLQPSEATEVRLKDAQRLLRNGRYAEAEEALASIEAEAKKAPATLNPALKVALALAKADSQASQGEYAKAIDGVKMASATDPKNADLLARLADLYLARGDWDAAETAMLQAKKIDPDHLQARWVEGRLLELRGELEKAVQAWKWFVDRYNEKRAEIVASADALVLVGQAAERYYRASARGEELSDSLNDVINDIYEAALRADPNCWQAPLLEGRLFLSGYNERAATRELARAQQINPLSPEIKVTLGQADLQGYRLAAGRSKAEQALAINPHYAPAYVLLADLNISDERFADAKAAAQKAVAENPRDEDALGAAGGCLPAFGRPSRRGCCRAHGHHQQPSPRDLLRRTGRAAGRSPQVSFRRASLLARRGCRPQPAPMPRSAWGCSTCRSVAKPRPRACSTPPSKPTRSTSVPTT